MKTNINKSLFQPLADFKLTLENSLPEIIIKIFTRDSSRSYQLFFLLLIGIVASLSIILINIGIPPINALPTDISILLESGWRIINGQTPHLDYYSPLGIFTSLPIAFGMKISSPSASSIAYGNVLLLVIFTPWAWLIARDRLSALNAFLFALFMALLLVAPRPLGSPMSEVSYAMLYNRQAFVFLSMLFLEIFITPRTPKKAQANRQFFGGLSSGILFTLIFYCKVNYFAISIFAILLRLILFRFSKAWFFGCLSGVMTVFLGVYILFGLNLFSYITDISFAAKSQDKIQKLHNLKGVLFDNFYWLYLIFMLIVINSLNQNKNTPELSNFWHKTRPQIIATFVALSGILICGTNSQATDIPLFFVAGLILLEQLRREFQLHNYSVNSFSGLKYFLTIAIVTLFCVVILLQDLGSITSAVLSNKLKLTTLAQSQQLHSKTMSDLLVVENSADYPLMINDGLDLISPYKSKDSRVLALDFANPFSFALELPPPTGDALWWHYHHTFSQESFPEAEKVFRDVNLVIIPKQSDEGSSASKYMQEIYGDYLHKNFQKQDNSQFWTLWTKVNNS
jgi:hypothetical protein